MNTARKKPITVRPGQVWADNDPRAAGRTLRVEQVNDGVATCTILTNSTNAQAALDGEDSALTWMPKDTRGRIAEITAARMRPTRTGYRLIRDRQYGIRWPTGVVFAGYPTREAATEALTRHDNGRGLGEIVTCEYEPDTSNSTDWMPVT